NLLHEVRRHRFVRRLEMRRDPTFVEQVQAGVLSHSLDIQALAMPKLEPSTDHMDAPKEASHPLALRSRAELRPAPALAFEERETKLLVLEQRPSVVNDRRDDGHLRRGQLQGETVLLLDGGIAPSPGTIELRHERLRLLDAHLIDAVFVAIQRQDAPIRYVADGLDRRDDHIRRQSIV